MSIDPITPGERPDGSVWHSECGEAVSTHRVTDAPWAEHKPVSIMYTLRVWYCGFALLPMTEGTQMTKHIGRALVVLAGTMLTGALLAVPASAQTEHIAASAWSADVDAFIVDATTVELRGANTSVETTNLDFPVQAHHKIKFTYELLDGAVCGAGAPRVFVEIDGDYIN